MKVIDWAFIIVITVLCLGFYSSVQRERGEALSGWLQVQYGMEVPSSVAQHFNVVVTTTDVQLSIDQFQVFE